jgi:hypothetical protein
MGLWSENVNFVPYYKIFYFANFGTKHATTYESNFPTYGGEQC